MKKLLLTTALTTLAMPAFAAAPQLKMPTNMYVSLGAGVTNTRDSDWSGLGRSGTIGLDSDANGSIAIGTSFYKDTRVELEAGYRKNDVSSFSVNGFGSAPADGSVKTTTLLLNGYYDFLEGQKFRPYISAGLGIAHDKGNMSSALLLAPVSGSDTVFAYQVGLGASYQIMPKTALWAGYRYLGSDKPDFDGIKATYNADEFKAGLRFNF